MKHPDDWWRAIFSRDGSLDNSTYRRDGMAAMLNRGHGGPPNCGFPVCLYPMYDQLPSRRVEIPIWTREQLITFDGNSK